MRKLALDESIMLKIEKPARYIGNEINSVMKDLNDVSVRFCMCFPDVYEIGMSHLGIQILYDMFNKMKDVWCERVYSPWPDLDKVMRDKKIPLFALESQDPVREFDFLGITLQYEMCYTNILQILDLSQIPLHSIDRTDNDPIVIGGGPCSYNPEPIADFFDIFYMGEGEVSYQELIDKYKEAKEKGLSRDEFLKIACRIPGLYVPRFYDVSYNEDGTLKSFEPNNEYAPKVVYKQVVNDLSASVYPDKPVVPYIQATQDRAVLEIMRGCTRGCRFCQAGVIYRPNREKDPKVLIEKAEQIIKNTGYDEITLSSLSSSDYYGLKDLLDFLLEYCSEHHVNISLPSLRLDAFSLDVMSKVQDVKKSSLTFAPEAGTQRMRNVINKGIKEEHIFKGITSAFKGGWNKVKLYFMLGLPGETVEDMKGIPDLCERIAVSYYETVPKEERIGKCQITASSSFFIPKPFTAFQWCRQIGREECIERAHIVKDEFKTMLNHKSLKYQYHEPDISELEGVFARGDRKLSALIECAYNKGCIFDAWKEYYDDEKWKEAYKECGLDPEFYLRERKSDELLPWDFINIGVTKKFLLEEYERSLKGEITHNCKKECNGCGANVYGGGVCYYGRKN